MKAIVLGVVGVGGVGAAAYVGTSGGPDDYIGHVSKSPRAVYAAFSALGQEGVIAVPGEKGWGSRVRQRITKVAGEEIKIAVEVDGKELISAEIHVSADGEGTRIAAELEFDKSAMNDLLGEAGGAEIPSFAGEEYLIDQVFARAMGEAVERIEAGKPLLSLGETRARWGRDGGGVPGAPGMSGSRASGTWQQRQAVRPQMDARPTLDPNAAARGHVRNGERTERR